MYASGLTTRQITEQIEEIYGFKVSEGFVSDVTDKILHGIFENNAEEINEGNFHCKSISKGCSPFILCT